MTGEVAGLWPKEDLDGVLNDVRQAFKHESPGDLCMWCAMQCGVVL